MEKAFDMSHLGLFIDQLGLGETEVRAQTQETSRFDGGGSVHANRPLFGALPFFLLGRSPGAVRRAISEKNYTKNGLESEI